MKLILGAAAALIVLITGLQVLWSIGMYVRPLATVRVYGITESRDCPQTRATEDVASMMKRRAIRADILHSSKLIRSEGDLRLYSTRHGDWWLPDGPTDLLPILLSDQATDIYGEIRPGDIVIDCGAHVGIFTRHALEHGAAKVIAVEPAPAAIECFRRNLSAQIASGTVIPIAKGIWDATGELPFNLNGNADAAGSFLYNNGGKPRITLPVTTIDALVSELNPPAVTLIKADIKGAGANMLRGAAETIRRFHPRLVIATEERTEDPGELIRIARSFHPIYDASVRCCCVFGNYFWTGALEPEVLFLH